TFGLPQKGVVSLGRRLHQCFVTVVPVLHSPTPIFVVKQHHRRERLSPRNQGGVLFHAPSKVAQAEPLALLLMALWQAQCEWPGPDVTIGPERQGKWRVILVEARKLHARALPVAPAGGGHGLGRVGSRVK